jgi:hypothetical protein
MGEMNCVAKSGVADGANRSDDYLTARFRFWVGQRLLAMVLAQTGPEGGVPHQREDHLTSKVSLFAVSALAGDESGAEGADGSVLAALLRRGEHH